MTGKYAGNDWKCVVRDGQLMEPVVGERSVRQGVPPVVEVADDQGRQGLARGAEEGVVEEAADLPVPLVLEQAEMPVDQAEPPFRGLDDRDLGPARLPAPEPERDLVQVAGRPARQDEVAVAPLPEVDVELIKRSRRVEGLGEALGLVVVPRPADVPIDLLKADQVGGFLGDHPDDPLDPIAPVAPSDPLVDVVAQESHRGRVPSAEPSIATSPLSP